MNWRPCTVSILLGLVSLAMPSVSAEQVVIRGADGEPTVLYPGSYALVIGAARYEDPSWNDLTRVPEEVDHVASMLGVHGFDVEIVSDPRSDELHRALRDFVVKHGFTKANSENRLLIFFSGHGHTRPGDRGYLVPVDAPDPTLDEAGFLSKALDMVEVMSWARRIEAKHALFVFDSCFSGTLFETRALPRPGEAYIRASTAKPVRQFITAGDAGQEVPASSIFTPLFLEALEGEADTNSDGYVTGTELGLYLMQIVPDYNPAQTPRYGKILDVHLDDGDFVFETHEPPLAITPQFRVPPEAADVPSLSTSETPVVTWKRVLGGENEEDAAYALEAMADGSVVVAGFTGGSTGDGWLLKLDIQGEQQWQRSVGKYIAPEAMRSTADGYVVAGGGTVRKLNSDVQPMWTRRFEDRQVSAVQPTDDGGYIVVGRTDQSDDAWVLKLDGNGETIWERIFTHDGWRNVTEVVISPDGGYLVVGDLNNPSSDASDAWAVKLDALGEPEWERTFGGKDEAWATAVQVAADGGYVIAGSTEREGEGESGWVAKVDLQGRPVWARRFDSGLPVAIDSTADGGYVVAGPATDPASEYGDTWVLKLDGQGDSEWERTFEGFAATATIGATSDGGYVLAGWTPGLVEPNFHDAWVLKLDRDGKLKADVVERSEPRTPHPTMEQAQPVTWERIFEHPGMDEASAVQTTADGGYIILGTLYWTGGENASTDILVLKLDAQGRQEWERRFRGQDSEDEGFDLQKTADGGYIIGGTVTGEGYHDAWVLKLDAQGRQEWERRFEGYGGISSGTDGLTSALQPTADGGYIIGGSKESKNHWFQGWLLKLNAQGRQEWEQALGKQSAGVTAIYPTVDGGYAVAGYEGMEHAPLFQPPVAASREAPAPGGPSLRTGDAWVLKLDAQGRQEWEQTFGGQEEELDMVTAIYPTVDGGYVVAGITGLERFGEQDAWVLKLDAQGRQEQEQTFEAHAAFDLQPTADGRYIIGGYKEDKDGSDHQAWVLKLDAQLQQEWQQTHSGSEVGPADKFKAVQTTADGGYVVAGNRIGQTDLHNIWVMKLDQNGQVQSATAAR